MTFCNGLLHHVRPWYGTTLSELITLHLTIFFSRKYILMYYSVLNSSSGSVYWNIIHLIWSFTLFVSWSFFFLQDISTWSWSPRPWACFVKKLWGLGPLALLLCDINMVPGGTGNVSASIVIVATEIFVSMWLWFWVTILFGVLSNLPRTYAVTNTSRTGCVMLLCFYDFTSWFVILHYTTYWFRFYHILLSRLVAWLTCLTLLNRYW